MKRILILAAITIITAVGAGCASSTQAAAPSSQAAEQPVESKKAVLGVRTPRHMKVALLTARQMLGGEEGWQAEKVDIVACGGAVPALQKGGELAEDIARTQKMGARIAACGLTVNRKGIAKDSFVAGIEVVPNGLTEIIRLQSEGHLSLEL